MAFVYVRATGATECSVGPGAQLERLANIQYKKTLGREMAWKESIPKRQILANHFLQCCPTWGGQGEPL